MLGPDQTVHSDIAGINLWVVLLFSALSTACAMSKGDLERGMANEEFTLWCGDRACAWEVDQGRVEPVPTWHRKAYGIGLVEDLTRISQVVEMEGVTCLLIAILANVEEKATLHWEVDFYNDDIENPEEKKKITTRGWETVYQEVPVPLGCNEARIILRKEGSGQVVIAKAEVMGNTYCAPNPEPGATSTEKETDTFARCEDDGGPC